MSAAIEKRDDKIDSLQNRLSNLRKRAQEESRELLGAGAELGACFALGHMEARAQREGRTLESPIEGVDLKVAYGVGLFVAGRFVEGDAGLLMQNAGRGILAVKAYEEGKASGARR